jgi:hypothetical protein
MLKALYLLCLIELSISTFNPVQLFKSIEKLDINKKYTNGDNSITLQSMSNFHPDYSFTDWRLFCKLSFKVEGKYTYEGSFNIKVNNNFI